MATRSFSRRSFVASASAIAAAAALNDIVSLPFPFQTRKSAFAASASDVSATPMCCVYNQATEECARDLGLIADLGQVGQGEFASFCFKATNNATSDLDVQELYVTVDGSEPWGWAPFSFRANSTINLHVYYVNMQRCLGEGNHSASLYLNGQLICSANFTVMHPMNWGAVFPFPAQADIDAANQAADCRSPYVFGQYDIASGTAITAFSVDFKAETAPCGTYCCLFQWAVDLSEFKNRYPDAHTESQAGGYAGLQRLANGNWASILSFWDVYYTDESGNSKTLRANLLYPEPNDNMSFGGEGEGAHRIVDYPWRAGSWYRMVLACSTSQSGTTVIDQTICDLQTGKWTRLCSYDTGIPNAYFMPPNFFFLEDFDKTTRGEVRCMEVANAYIQLAGPGEVVQIGGAYMGPNGGRPTYGGSYAFGTQGNRFWAITSGAGGDWFESGQGQQNGWYYLSAW